MNAFTQVHRSCTGGEGAIAIFVAALAKRLMPRLLLALAGMSLAMVASAQTVSQYEVKAAFLYNFTRFVEWPQERFATPEDPIVIGVLGGGAMLTSLTDLVANRRVSGRPVVVVQVESVAAQKLPHVLFVSAAEHEHFVRMLPALVDQTLLTVTDAQPCSTALAQICFVEVGNKLRFDIDMDAATRSHLHVSSQLQKLARTIRRTEKS